MGICKQVRFQFLKSIKMKEIVFRKKEHRKSYVLRSKSFLMLDILAATAIIFLTLHLFLASYFIVSKKTSENLKENTCDTFFISMKIRDIMQDGNVNFESVMRVYQEDIFIDIKSNGQVVKGNTKGGYEYLGTCENATFEKEESNIYFTATVSKNNQKIRYLLTKKEI